MKNYVDIGDTRLESDGSKFTIKGKIGTPGTLEVLKNIAFIGEVDFLGASEVRGLPQQQQGELIYVEGDFSDYMLTEGNSIDYIITEG